MGWLKKAAKSLKGSVGGFMNDVTGKSDSARQQFEHQMALQHDAQEFSKWQMQNAHQTEVEDLKKAGLNPALSAGGGGASAGVSVGSASDGGAGINPMALIQGMVDSVNSAKATNAQVQQANANTAKTQAETWNIVKRTEPEIDKIMTETSELNQRIKESQQKIKESKSNEEKNKAEAELSKTEAEYKDWLNQYPWLRALQEGGIIGGISNVGSGYVTARALKKGAESRNRYKKTRKDNYNKKGELINSTITTKY